MVEIKCIRWTSVDTWRHLRRLMKIEWKALCDESTSRNHKASSCASIRDPRAKI